MPDGAEEILGEKLRSLQSANQTVKTKTEFSVLYEVPGICPNGS